jgi:hypothetical protein
MGPPWHSLAALAALHQYNATDRMVFVAVRVREIGYDALGGQGDNITSAPTQLAQ